MSKSALIANLRPVPDRLRALANYRRVAEGYDASSSRIEALRDRAIAELALQPGDCVLDVACGTGATLPRLAAALGAAGTVIGVEQSPEMAVQAQRRADADAQRRIRVQTCPVEEMPLEGPPVDALLLCWTHDVLQTPAALDRLVARARPGARIAIAGMISVPWLWGWPINLVNLYRSRHYATTWANLDRPFRGLEARGARLQIIHRALWGTAYIAVGRMPTDAVPRITP